MINSIPILMYHNIVEQEIPNAPDWITIALLEQQLAYLQKKKYTFITPHLLLTPHLLPKKPILITFDDGYENVYKLAFPILKEYNINFSLFLIANFLSDETITKFNTWDAEKRPKAAHLSKKMIIEMLNSKLLTIGSHSFSHQTFHQLTEKEINDELMLSKKQLESFFLIPITYFSYPGGYVGNKKNTFNLLKKHQYTLAFGGQKDVVENSKWLIKFNIKRINITNESNFTNQKAKLRFEVIIHPLLNKLSTFNKLNFLIHFLLPFYK
ncbi:MAG: hypothetical protein COW67_08720 [Flavobacteriales bacterium CG18_big_fil_WC_8_21_14_2_50_32_9]|nr:MAG: hypothetical protein COW67_08720 [Flavobacteriales bacterium CG18_big_fil_WC_8_21_14_2_50_32_9]PJC62559.1 MAG: hypothetical protein CO022_03910 [Flavobacteriales bacterium CG_4_9_14_0_2_um_filter_32_27]